jgi:hypothetical protein
MAITAEIGYECREGVVTYFYGHLPLFQHQATDRASFRILTSQMILKGAVREAGVVRTFAVPRITVRRSVRKLREQGVGSVFVDRRRGSARVVKGEVRAQAQQLLEQGVGVPEMARRLGVKANTLHKAIRQGRLRQPERVAGPAPASTNSERSEADSAAPMG